MKLKDIGTIVTGNTPSKKNNEYYESNDILFVKPSDIEENYITSIEKSEEYISEKAREKARVLPEGAVLVTCIGTIGKVGILKQEATCNQQINAIIPNDKVISKYLAYLMQSRQKILQLKANAPVVPIINKTDFSEIEINICDIEQQKQIVRQLDLLKSIIDKRKVQIDELQNIVKSQFVEMFGDPFLNDKKWKTNTIGNCCTLKSGNSLSAEVENEGGDVLYVKVGDMNLKGNEKYITTSSHKVTRKTAGKGIFELGTILFPKRGGAIGTNKKRLTNSKVCADLNIMGVTPIKEIISEYLFTYFLFIDLGTLNNGSSLPQINNKDIEPLIIQIPPIELQNQFAEIVKQIDKQKFESVIKAEKEIEKIQNNIYYKWGR